MQMSLIFATNNNYVIGDKGSIPWHKKEDMKLFKHLTLNKVLIMGRKTFESLGRPLLGRDIVVVSSRPIVGGHSVHVVDSLPDAIYEAKEVIANKALNPEIMVAGGAGIYKTIIDCYSVFVDTIYWSKIDDNSTGDTTFPSIAFIQSNFVEVYKERMDGFEFNIMRKPMYA